LSRAHRLEVLLKHSTPRLGVALLLTVAFLAPTSATAQADVEGSSDHPLVSRYQGALIVKYDQREFDSYELLTGPVSSQGPSATESLEGEVTQISYQVPEARSTLEVFRNYEQELAAAGFEVVYTCANEDCGGRSFNHAVMEYMSGFAENYSDQRFMAVRRSRADSDVAASLYVVRNTSEGGARANQIFYRLDVIEGTPMDVGMVDVDAETMAREISETGSVSIYGILFDTDQTDIKPESEATLNEITRLLEADGALQLYVVGHTDNVGARDYNMDLSRRRADAVVAALAGRGVDPSRLEPDGVGPLAPVASNDADAGRTLNRRVELVKR